MFILISRGNFPVHSIECICSSFFFFFSIGEIQQVKQTIVSAFFLSQWQLMLLFLTLTKECLVHSSSSSQTIELVLDNPFVHRGEEEEQQQLRLELFNVLIEE